MKTLKKIAFISIILFCIRTQTIYAKTEIIPLPAFSTQPNTGEFYGIMPVMLKVNKKGEMRQIMAPSASYNAIYGVSGTFRFYGYSESGRRSEVLAGISTNDDRYVKLRYFTPKLYRDDIMLDIEYKYINDIGYRFFGIGPNTNSTDETNYTHNEARFRLKVTKKLLNNFNASIQERFNDVEVKTGKITKLPYSKDRFPGMAGMNRTQTLAHELAVTFDDRDDSDIPTRGTFISFYSEIGRKILKTDSSFIKYGVKFSHLIPLFPNRKKRFTFAIRAMLQRIDTKELAFYELSMMGGEDSLRGYGKNRFFDKNMLLLGAEQRIVFYKSHFYNVTCEWEVAPFFEIGRVFNEYGHPLFKEYKMVSGVGVRAIVKPSVVGRVDIGIGSEGPKVFVGLGYPF